jgi:RimJ/RimL family protein N-acetyltransferase
MITPNTLRIDYEINHAAGQSQLLYLAPFGEAELAQVAPLSTDGLYFPEDDAELYAQDPAALVATYENLEHSQDWGIYQGEVSPETFQGVAHLSQKASGEPDNLQYDNLVQETGLYIMRPSGRQKGLGTLARLAMMTYTLDCQETLAFQAQVSEHNTISQRSLTKTGFILLDTVPDLIRFTGGEATQQWAAVHPSAQASIAENATEAEALAAGWQRYEAQRQHLSLTVS